MAEHAQRSAEPRPHGPDEILDEPAARDCFGGGLVRLRLDLGYDGNRYAGWATQPGQRTVQQVLETALATVLRVPDIRLTCAGRTDAGVHARGQVAHVDVPAEAVGDGALIARRLAGLLPDDVRVFRIVPAAPGFDARFSALFRRYAYRVSDASYGVDPLRRHEVLWNRHPLDLDAMNAAAALLLGEHDFSAFCRRRQGASTVRTLRTLTWSRDVTGIATATVEADAFCHSMVRSLIGALLPVGEGRRPTTWPAELLAAGERHSAAFVVPAHGLTLEHVAYPDDDQLSARAMSSRRRREIIS